MVPICKASIHFIHSVTYNSILFTGTRWIKQGKLYLCCMFGAATDDTPDTQRRADVV